MNSDIRESRQIYKKLLVGVIILAIVIVLPVISLADVGNNVDHSSGGGSSSSGGSGYTTSSFEVFYLISMLMRLGPVGWVILVIIGIIFFKYTQGNKPGTRSYHNPINEFARDTYEVDRESINTLLQEDDHFSEQIFISQITNMFMRLQLAWMNKKWEEARPFESDALFNTHHMQLSQYINSKTTNKIEDICVVNTEIQRYRKVNEYEYLDVIIDARLIDYIVNDETGKVIKGNPKKPVHMKYKWKMMRKQGVKSTYAHVNATECPNCGANISINQAGKCEYCGSVVTRGDYDWVLSEIEVISQS